MPSTCVHVILHRVIMHFLMGFYPRLQRFRKRLALTASIFNP
ncbi:hypothetical protein NP493_1744g00073 [Ridgeia piscesae]|uniref:Uncharacterized protein n=1 Tax=Ridgeia piscesae TaxID=27915 RepID=A0AAD9JVC3_RIDPI|nr:hypothetical protein NP493_1744g00073 [Ridgeia piscesae]